MGAGLSARDYDAVLAAVGALGDVDDVDAFAEASVAAVGHLVASDVTSLNEVDPPTGRLHSVMSPPIEVPAEQVRVLSEGSARHPLIAYVTRCGDGSARRISDLLSTDAWHAHELYEGFYRPLGLEHQVSITLPAPLPTLVAYAANRERHDFSDRDVAVLDLFRPHLAQRWRTVRDLTVLRGLAAASTSVLLEHGTHAVLVQGGTVTDLTPGARQLLERYSGPLPDALLPTPVRRWLAVAEPRPGRPPAAHLLVRGERRLVLRRLPAGEDHPEVVLMSEQDARPPQARLRPLGLTDRESSVLAMLTEGRTNAEIAQGLLLSPATVKRYLDAIYTKLGVRGRVQAVTTALEVLAHHPPERE